MDRARGVTLIEVLIVAIVLAIVAAVVTPQFSRANDDSRLAGLRSGLLDVREQIRLYRTQHGDQFPSQDQFVAQMTLPSDPCGQTSGQKTGAFTLGPYLLSIPTNPCTGGNRVGKGAIGTSDWYYDAATGLFRANHDSRYATY